MKRMKGWRVAAVVGLCGLMTGSGCRANRRTRSAPKSDAFAEKLKPIVASKNLQVLHWPNFSDYEPLVQTFYEDRNYEVAWVENYKPSAQAAAFIRAFQEADRKGLNLEDYDASKWDSLTQKLAGKNDDDVAQFDAAMTVSVMRYISDLRIGRVNPTHFNFDIHTADKKYDLPEFVSDNAVDATDVPKLIQSVEPDSDAYRKLEDALAQYTDLAKKQAASADLMQPLPTVTKPVTVGGAYPALAQLTERLQLEGDVTTAPAPGDTGYNQDLADGIKRYQTRHSLTPDGKLTAATIASLNVPLTIRVNQIKDSLERWRWLPDEYVNAPLIVNLPEFVLHGYTDEGGSKHKLDFTMKVVVGKVLGDHDTPVFAHMMKYVIFRPYWNVPISIIKKELTGHIQKSGVGYLAAHNFETVDNAGHVVQASASQVEHFGVNVREKPGPKNSLGLIKFMFPNEYDIYMHSTPQPELFERTRRDFSHGCVRVQKPVDLAVWVLAHGGVEGDWDLDKVTQQMQSGPDNHQVNLKKPLPIVIFYLTADYGEDGQMHFFDDIYGYDKELEAVLAKGMPYPAAQQKVNPKASPEGTQ
jgi:murein L,D-transpeptidase YcbB/YkuD